MSAAEPVGAFMARLEALGLRFGLREGRLILDAPAGVLTLEVRATITARKGAVKRLVQAALVPCAPPPRPAPPRPTRRCYMCATLTWRQRPDGEWVCGVCHPLTPRPSFSLDHLSAAVHRDRSSGSGADGPGGGTARDVSAGGARGEQ